MAKKTKHAQNDRILSWNLFRTKKSKFLSKTIFFCLWQITYTLLLRSIWTPNFTYVLLHMHKKHFLYLVTVLYVFKTFFTPLYLNTWTISKNIWGNLDSQLLQHFHSHTCVKMSRNAFGFGDSRLRRPSEIFSLVWIACLEGKPQRKY